MKPKFMSSISFNEVEKKKEEILRREGIGIKGTWLVGANELLRKLNITEEQIKQEVTNGQTQN